MYTLQMLVKYIKHVFQPFSDKQHALVKAISRKCVLPMIVIQLREPKKIAARQKQHKDRNSQTVKRTISAIMEATRMR